MKPGVEAHGRIQRISLSLSSFLVMSVVALEEER